MNALGMRAFRKICYSTARKTSRERRMKPSRYVKTEGACDTLDYHRLLNTFCKLYRQTIEGSRATESAEPLCPSSRPGLEGNDTIESLRFNPLTRHVRRFWHKWALLIVQYIFYTKISWLRFFVRMGQKTIVQQFAKKGKWNKDDR